MTELSRCAASLDVYSVDQLCRWICALITDFDIEIDASSPPHQHVTIHLCSNGIAARQWAGCRRFRTHTRCAPSIPLDSGLEESVHFPWWSISLSCLIDETDMTLFPFKSFQATGAKQNKGAYVCTPLQLTFLAFVNPSYSTGVPGFTRLRAFLDTSRARGRSRLSLPDLLHQ